MAHLAWIEDDHQRISALVKLLKDDGHIILPYASLQEAQNHILLICKCDIVILDIILPPSEDDPYTGVNLLKTLREEHDYKGEVVVCSRVRNPAVLLKLQELDVKTILNKPIRPSTLHSVITKILTAG